MVSFVGLNTKVVVISIFFVVLLMFRLISVAVGQSGCQMWVPIYGASWGCGRFMGIWFCRLIFRGAGGCGYASVSRAWAMMLGGKVIDSFITR